MTVPEKGTVLSVDSVAVHGPAGVIVQDVSLHVHRGQMAAVIGESGSGKSLTLRAALGLLPQGLRATGTVHHGGQELDLARTPSTSAQWTAIRGRQAVLIPQDPFTSLSPVHRCGDQIRWGLTSGGDQASSRQRIAELLDDVGLLERVMRQYPHELSGGMRQRVAIAASLAAEPHLLVADEPTTALDATTQGEILDLLDQLRRQRDLGVVLISHDLGVVKGRADTVTVMRQGTVVEAGPTAQVLSHPEHEYTRSLLAASPTLNDIQEPLPETPEDVPPLLEVRGLTKSFGGRSAVDSVDFTIDPGQVVAVVGESGSGKSTLARCIAGLEIPDDGTIRLRGVDLPPGRRGRTPGQMQIVFQDPYSTLNPRLTVSATLAEALRARERTPQTQTLEPKRRIAELLEDVGLDPAMARVRPGRLSGGQRQRVSIARALAVNPDLLICDESVSALDVSVQAKVLDLLAEVNSRTGVSMLFISHDLAVVSQVAHHVIVLREGRIVESGAGGQVLTAPQDPYTRTLVEAARKEML